jgi:hypothetical protein
LVESLLSKIESAGTAEKIAENDHLMKCIHPFLPFVLLSASDMPFALRLDASYLDSTSNTHTWPRTNSGAIGDDPRRHLEKS